MPRKKNPMSMLAASPYSFERTGQETDTVVLELRENAENRMPRDVMSRAVHSSMLLDGFRGFIM